MDVCWLLIGAVRLKSEKKKRDGERERERESFLNFFHNNHLVKHVLQSVTKNRVT